MKKSFVLLVALFISAAVVSTAYAGSKKTGDPYPKDIDFGKGGQPVIFSHKAHVEDFGQPCDSCHTKIFELKIGAASEKGDFNMASINSGRYCGACHDGQTAFSADDYSRCASCHLETPAETSASPGADVVGPREDIQLGSDDSVAVFKHTAHDKLACRECHTALFPMKKTKTITSMDEINGKKACGTCHDGKRAFDASDCGKCHPKM